jgi:hypothetical protein
MQLILKRCRVARVSPCGTETRDPEKIKSQRPTDLGDSRWLDSSNDEIPSGSG